MKNKEIAKQIRLEQCIAWGFPGVVICSVSLLAAMSRAARPNGNTQTKEPASRLTSVVIHYDIATDEYHHYHVAIPEAADEIIQKECSVPQDNPFATIEDVRKTTLILFAS